MMFKRVFALLAAGLLLSMTAMVYADVEMEPQHPRQRVTVDEVEIRDTLGATTFFIRGMLTDSCDTLMWAYQWSNDVLFIDVYREVRPEVACAAVETPYEFVLPLQTLIDEQIGVGEQFVAVINNLMLRLDWQPRGTLPYSLLLSRGVVSVETVARAAGGVRLTGQMGCGYLIARATRDMTMPETSAYIVEAYLAVDPAMMCIAGFVPFDVTVPSDAPEQAAYTVNGFIMPREFVTDPVGQVYSIMEMPVESVASTVAESFPPQLRVTARGTTDGCDFPIQLVFEPLLEGLPYITARVARVVPVGIACPAVAVPFTAQGSLVLPTADAGEYTLLVNGIQR